MPLNKGKHIVEEIQEKRCTIVETGASADRLFFLKNLLEFNGFTVYSAKEQEDEPATYKIGVDDIIFNPVIAVYARKLKSPDGHRVTPAYWNQWNVANDIPYWKIKQSNIKPV
ncbi:MAG: hypothetical protein M0R21_13330 [Lentimicrobiaceae bacterium]|jgi:hypothetical protein|nr:hypothetical protein [Lentimicrobiaceae bacterium]